MIAAGRVGNHPARLLFYSEPEAAGRVAGEMDSGVAFGSVVPGLAPGACLWAEGLAGECMGGSHSCVVRSRTRGPLGSRRIDSQDTLGQAL